MPAREAEAPVLRACALDCVRGDEVIFEHLEFAVGPGEILQIVGANGSGKTSLLRMLAGLSPPAGGELRWGDRPLPDQPGWSRALLYQGAQSGFSGNLTVAENLRHACTVAGRGRCDSLATALQRVGLAARHDQPVQRLSSGQRQRLGLARLLLVPARVWLLDEPMNALDRAGQRLLEALLLTHVAGGGLAVVATHQRLELPTPPLRTLALEDLPA